MITPEQFIILCIAVFALFYIVVRVYAEAHPVPQTVEAEQASTQEVVATNAQWSGVTTQPEYVDEHEADIPFSLIEGMHRNNATII